MRRLLRRKAVTIIAAILSLAAIPAAGIVATATPALASVTICNTGGYYNFCVGDSGPLNNGDQVVLTDSGRQINKVDQKFTCCGGFEVYQLQFAANTSQCVGVNGYPGSFVTVRDCSGGNNSNVNWAREPAGGGVEWFSTTKQALLSSDNHLGSQLFVVFPACNGCYVKWTG